VRNRSLGSTRHRFAANIKIDLRFEVNETDRLLSSGGLL
jgi:hypothetical protein